MTSGGRGALAPDILSQIVEAIQSLRFGSVQITVQDARIVKIEKVERIRVASADLSEGGDSTTLSGADRPVGGSRPGSGRHGPR